MEKLNEMSVKLADCVNTLHEVFVSETQNKIDQAVVVIDMAKAYIEDALDRETDRDEIERKLTDCLCAIASVLETLDNSLTAEHNKVSCVEKCLREIV